MSIGERFNLEKRHNPCLRMGKFAYSISRKMAHDGLQIGGYDY